MYIIVFLKIDHCGKDFETEDKTGQEKNVCSIELGF